MITKRTRDILPVVFLNITCATILRFKHLSVPYTQNYTWNVINYVHIQNDFHLMQ